jgi:hypothetical protein
MSALIPSYHQGFADHAGVSECPELWSGLAGLWEPGLGPTGDTLFDHSGYRRNGTLTGMTLATDWQLSGAKRPPGYVLNYDDTDNWIDFGALTFLNSVSQFSVTAWVKRALTEFCYVVQKGTSATVQIQLGILNDDNCYLTVRDGSAVHRTAANSNTAWQHLAWVYNGNLAAGTRGKIFFDGVEQATGGSTLPTATGSMSGNLGIGRTPLFGAIYSNCQIGGVKVWTGALTPNQIQLDYEQPMGMLTLRRPVYSKAAAAGVAPTGHLYGPLVGPLGGAV